MPYPIRSVGHGYNTLPNDEKLLFPSMQNSYLGICIEREATPLKKVRASEKQKRLLLEIWQNNDGPVLDAQKVAGVREEDLAFIIPKSMNVVDVADITNSGLVERIGNGMVRLTEAGKIEMSREIMGIPSEIIKERTRDKYIYCSKKDKFEKIDLG